MPPFEVPYVQQIPNPLRVTSASAVSASPGRVWALLLEGGSDASSCDMTNDADGSGTPIVGITAPFTDTDASAASTVFVSFVELGGLEFTSKIYAKLAGTGAVVYVWYTSE